MIRSLFKEVARVRDKLIVEGGVSSTGRGIRMPDGTAVPVEKIMVEFGVSRQEAEKIALRRSQ
jgi:hypothetical protein